MAPISPEWGIPLGVVGNDNVVSAWQVRHTMCRWAACAPTEQLLVNLQFKPIDQVASAKISGAGLLTRFYLRIISLGTVIFVLVVSGIFWIGWQRQYAIEVNLINQRVQESAVNLKFIIKAASGEITQLSSWANNFPNNAPDARAHLFPKTLGTAHPLISDAEISLDARAAWPPEQRLGQMLALSSAKQPRAGGAPSNLDMGVALLDRVGDGLKTSDFLRWTYFNAAAKDLLVVAPWMSKKDFLAEEPHISSFLAHSWTLEVATAGLPENNPKRQPYWTQAYLDQGGAGLMVSHGAPVYWGNEFVGIVATDLQLDFLNVFLRQFPDPEGVLTISNAQGQILGDRSGKTAAGSTGIKLLADVLPPASRGVVGQPPLQGLRIGNELVFSTRLEDPRWTILFELPQATVNARVARAFAYNFYLLLVLVIGYVVIQYALWRMYVSPALQIADFVAHGAAGTQPPAQPKVPGIWLPWFTAMSRAFGERQHYLAELQSSHALLDQRVQERTRELEAANDQLKEMSVTDALTGAFNRRYLFDALATECQRIARGGETLSVLMLDLDHFKNVNDQFGHAAGDAVLREFVLRCLELVRKTDMVCRYGGEEFMVFMPSMNCDGAVLLAQRLCRSIAATPVPFEGALIEVTVSIGVTSYRQRESVEAMLARADQLMYCAKHAGRSQVVSGV